MFGWIKRAFGSAANVAGEAYGDVENVIGRPLVPTKPYKSAVDQGALMRGTWPSVQDLKALKADGVRTVVNFCSERSDDGAVLAAGMVPVNVCFADNTAPSPEAVEHFLSVLAYSGYTYAHCEQGKGRTGCMIAAYRVILQGWTPAAALKEAEDFGLALPAQKQFILALVPAGLNQ